MAKRARPDPILAEVFNHGGQRSVPKHTVMPCKNVEQTDDTSCITQKIVKSLMNLSG